MRTKRIHSVSIRIHSNSVSVLFEKVDAEGNHCQDVWFTHPTNASRVRLARVAQNPRQFLFSRIFLWADGWHVLWLYRFAGGLGPRLFSFNALA